MSDVHVSMQVHTEQCCGEDESGERNFRGVLENFEGPPVSSNAAALELTVCVASPPL